MVIAAAPQVKLMRLEVVNKSAYPAQVKLNEINFDSPAWYYLPIEGMDEFSVLPVVKVFTLVRGLYDAEVYYCNQSVPTYFRLDFSKHAFRLVIPPCANKAQPGDQFHLKLNPNLYPALDLFDVPIIYNFIQYNWRY